MKFRNAILLILLLHACAGSVDTSLKKSSASETLDKLLQECIDDSFGSVPGVSVTVQSPFLKKNLIATKGFADKESNQELSANQPFRIASVTKTFVAAAIMRLHEMDSLSINDPIANYLDNKLITLLQSDGYDPQKILIKHCLNHTSGIFDYAVGGNDYIRKIIGDPKHRWTRMEQLEVAINSGDKLGEPGEITAYSDSGYVLLGGIIEKFFGGELAVGLRQLLKFDALKLNDTWLETMEAHPRSGDDVVHRYYGKYETTEWDASIDLYGGGGLVSTTSDLANFYSALFNNQLFDNKKTLELMHSLPENPNVKTLDKKDNQHYNYGFWTFKAFGEDVYMHNGFWGTYVLYLPKQNATIAINSTAGKMDRLIKKIILLVKEINEQQ